MARHDREYDWLEDPFNDKKRNDTRQSGGSKALVGIGCLLAVVLIIALVVFSLAGIADLAGSL